MDISIIFQIAGIGILTAVFHNLLQVSGRDEQAQMVTLGGLVVVLFIVLNLLSSLFDYVSAVFSFY